MHQQIIYLHELVLKNARFFIIHDDDNGGDNYFHTSVGTSDRQRKTLQLVSPHRDIRVYYVHALEREELRGA